MPRDEFDDREEVSRIMAEEAREREEEERDKSDDSGIVTDALRTITDIFGIGR